MLGIATDQTDGGTDCVGDIEIGWSQQFARTRQRGGQDRATTADEDDGNVAARQFHAIDCVGNQQICRG